MTVKFIQVKKTTLSYSISDSATTIKLDYLQKLDGTSLTASGLGTQLYGTFAPGTSREEIFSIDGTNATFNADGTVEITNVVRGLKEIDPYTTGGYSCDHGPGEIVIFGNNPQVYDAIYDYINAAIVAGAVPATDAVPGIVIEGTQAQVDAGTTQETYNAQNYDLFVRPDTLRAKKYHDAVASATGTDAYAITVVPAITAYATGQEFTFIADVANTTGATLNVSGVGAKTITKDVSTALATGDILAGQVIKVMYDGTNMQIVSILNNIAKTATVEVFTADGTYTMPANAKLLEVICIGAGGAGGSGGAKFNNGAQYSGGTGGGGGAKVIGTFIAAGITSPVTVTVATAPATDTAGGYSSFGTYLKAYGGGKGKFPQGNGENNTGAGGGGSMGVGADGTTTGSVLGGAPASVAGAVGFANQGAGGNTAADGVRAEYGGASGGGGLQSDVGKKGGSSLFGGAGGGAGGGIDGSTPGNPATSGAEGGASNSIVAGGGGAGGTSSGAGTAGTSRSGTGLCGDGGGGGGAKATSTAGAGGAGGAPGGGGGGGGSTAFGQTPGAGGAGGRGEVIVITYF